MQLALYQPDMAVNVGGAIRLAACFGVGLDIIEPCGFALTHRDIRRVAMDYAAQSPPRRWRTWTDFDDAARQADRRIILMTTRGDTAVWDHAFQRGDIVLMGRESAGVPEAVHEAAACRVTIPLAGDARSLNIVTAAAIALGEAARQRGLEGLATAPLTPPPGAVLQPDPAR